jgi:TusA-related sulfurtransferase
VTDDVESEHVLDLRGVACPMNFVKTKLYLDKVAGGTVVKVLLDRGEPVESVTTSIGQEGHDVMEPEMQEGGHYCVVIRKSMR